MIQQTEKEFAEIQVTDMVTPPIVLVVWFIFYITGFMNNNCGFHQLMGVELSPWNFYAYLMGTIILIFSISWMGSGMLEKFFYILARIWLHRHIFLQTLCFAFIYCLYLSFFDKNRGIGETIFLAKNDTSMVDNIAIRQSKVESLLSFVGITSSSIPSVFRLNWVSGIIPSISFDSATQHGEILQRNACEKMPCTVWEILGADTSSHFVGDFCDKIDRKGKMILDLGIESVSSIYGDNTNRKVYEYYIDGETLVYYCPFVDFKEIARLERLDGSFWASNYVLDILYSLYKIFRNKFFSSSHVVQAAHVWSFSNLRFDQAKEFNNYVSTKHALDTSGNAEANNIYIIWSVFWGTGALTFLWKPLEKILTTSDYPSNFVGVISKQGPFRFFMIFTFMASISFSGSCFFVVVYRFLYLSCKDDIYYHVFSFMRAFNSFWAYNMFSCLSSARDPMPLWKMWVFVTFLKIVNPFVEWPMVFFFRAFFMSWDYIMECSTGMDHRSVRRGIFHEDFTLGRCFSMILLTISRSQDNICDFHDDFRKIAYDPKDEYAWLFISFGCMETKGQYEARLKKEVSDEISRLRDANIRDFERQQNASAVVSVRNQRNKIALEAKKAVYAERIAFFRRNGFFPDDNQAANALNPAPLPAIPVV